MRLLSIFSVFGAFFILHCSPWQESASKAELRDPLKYYEATHPGADLGISVDGLMIWPAESVTAIAEGGAEEQAGENSESAQENPWLQADFLIRELANLEEESLNAEEESDTDFTFETTQSGAQAPESTNQKNAGPEVTPNDESETPMLYLGAPRLLLYKEGLGSKKRLWFENSAAGTSPLCRIVVYSNGKMTPYRSYLFSKRLAPLERFGLCTESELAERPEGCDQVMSTSFNGDDALELWCDDLLYDQFGLVGEDPGDAWQWQYLQLFSEDGENSGFGGQGFDDESISAAAGSLNLEESSRSITASSKDSWLLRCSETSAPSTQLMSGWFTWIPPEPNAQQSLETAMFTALESCPNLTF